MEGWLAQAWPGSQSFQSVRFQLRDRNSFKSQSDLNYANWGSLQVISIHINKINWPDSRLLPSIYPLPLSTCKCNAADEIKFQFHNLPKFYFIFIMCDEWTNAKISINLIDIYVFLMPNVCVCLSVYICYFGNLICKFCFGKSIRLARAFPHLGWLNDGCVHHPLMPSNASHHIICWAEVRELQGNAFSAFCRKWKSLNLSVVTFAAHHSILHTIYIDISGHGKQSRD